MSLFHVQQNRGALARPNERLPAGQAALVTTGLSILCWVMIIAAAAALRTMF